VKKLSSRYSISAICKVIDVDRSTYYYQPHPRQEDSALSQKVKQAFEESRRNYGTRKIKYQLAREGIAVSRRRIGQIMNRLGLVSNYTKATFKVHYCTCNEQKIPNILARDFNRKFTLDVVVSDLTYVRVNGRWCYVCLVIDLWNREIIGWAVGKRKDAKLVQDAIYSIPYRLDHINIFHTDRGKEFDNKLIEEVIEAFGIKRSLSDKGCPYDNSVNEATNHALKTELIHQFTFTSLEMLRIKLFDYIHWYNTKRLHSSLGYCTPIEVRLGSTNNIIYQSALKNCPK